MQYSIWKFNSQFEQNTKKNKMNRKFKLEAIVIVKNNRSNLHADNQVE